MKCPASLLFGLALLAAGTSGSQAQRAEIGPRAGITSSTLRVSSDESQQSRLMGIAAGGFMRFAPGHVGLQTELLFTRKGAALEGTDDVDFDLRLDYLEIPITLVVPLGHGRISGYVFGGPAIALELNCAAHPADGSESVDCDSPSTDLFDRNPFDLSGVIGAGMRRPLGSGALLLDARYTHGFSSVNDETGTDVRNRVISLSLGYGIPLR
jgi:hypothetical protein